jgi:hypothetical protein
MGFEALQWCHPSLVIDNPGVYGVRQINTKGVEAGVELVGAVGMDSVKIGRVLVKTMLRVLVLVKGLRGDGTICGDG